MVGVVKNKSDNTESHVTSSSCSSKSHKPSSAPSATDEQKIAKQLEDYQRALLKTNQKPATDQFDSNQSFAKILESQTQSSSEHLKLDLNNRKSFEDPAAESLITRSAEMDLEETVIQNLRRRASKDSYQDSPPEKRMRGSQVSLPTSPQPTSSATSSGRNKSSGKGKILH